jgi:hypothetical protein
MWKDFEKREKLLASLEEEHMATRADIAQMKTIGRSSYFSVASAITSEQEQMVKCIDYCTDILVNEPVQGLRKIIMDLVAPTQKKKLVSHLTLVQNFLKYQFDDHVSQEESKVSFHSSGTTLQFFYSLFLSCSSSYVHMGFITPLHTSLLKSWLTKSVFGDAKAAFFWSIS